MKSSRRLLPLLLLIALFSITLFVRATCAPSDTGTAGKDSIVCDTSNPPAGDVQGQGGDDTILIDTGVSASNVSGGNTGVGTESGSDVIINNGTVAGTINGDSKNSAGNGNDVIVNNGNAMDLI